MNCLCNTEFSVLQMFSSEEEGKGSKIVKSRPVCINKNLTFPIPNLSFNNNNENSVEDCIASSKPKRNIVKPTVLDL